MHYPDPNLSREEIAALAGDYLTELDYPVGILAETVRDALRVCKFRPTLAELRAIGEPKMAPLRSMHSRLEILLADAEQREEGERTKPAPTPVDLARKAHMEAEIQENLAHFRAKAEEDRRAARLDAAGHYPPGPTGARAVADCLRRNGMPGMVPEAAEPIEPATLETENA